MLQNEIIKRELISSPLSRKDTISIAGEWVKIFFAETKNKTGKYQPRNYKWESYWSGDQPCLNDDEALKNYLKNSVESFYIIDESGKNGVACPPQEWPSFLDSGLDLYIFPKSLIWSIAFTHEGTCHYASTKI